MNISADIYRRIINMIRVGTVHEVRHTHPPVMRVMSGDLITGWLPWIELRAGSTATWNPPTVGEQCVILSPDGDTSAGLVLVGLYQDGRKSPSSNPNEWVVAFPDGAVVRYDHSQSHLDATGIATGSIKASRSFVLECPDITLDGKVTVTDLLTYQAGLSGRDGKGNSTAITGDFAHKDGSLSSNGVVLDRHQHDGVQSGSSVSGDPV